MPKQRKKQRKPPIPKVKRKTRYYPVIFCTGENKVIGFSKSDIPLKANPNGKIQLKRKVSVRDWNEKCEGTWLSPEHKIDMGVYKDGDIVLCPACLKAVDFRVFPSNTVPTMISKAMKDMSE